MFSWSKATGRGGLTHEGQLCQTEADLAASVHDCIAALVTRYGDDATTGGQNNLVEQSEALRSTGHPRQVQLVVAGFDNCPPYERAVVIANDIAASNPTFKVVDLRHTDLASYREWIASRPPALESVLNTSPLAEKRKMSPFVFLVPGDGRPPAFIGGHDDLVKQTEALRSTGQPLHMPSSN